MNDDLISRQAVLNLFNKSDEFEWEISLIKRKIEKLPSVNPQEPKTGHWIALEDWFWKCSECRCCEIKKSDYCPNCGAKMVEPQEGSMI